MVCQFLDVSPAGTMPGDLLKIFCVADIYPEQILYLWCFLSVVFTTIDVLS